MRNIQKKNEANKRYYYKNRDRILAEARANSAEYYSKNKETLNLNSKRFKERNPERVILSSLKTRCSKNNIPFNLGVEDIIIPKYCPLLGIELKFGRDNWENSPSVDRLIPELGYVKGNVWIISMRANRIKCDASLDELKSIVNNLEIKLKENIC